MIDDDGGVDIRVGELPRGGRGGCGDHVGGRALKAGRCVDS